MQKVASLITALVLAMALITQANAKDVKVADCFATSYESQDPQYGYIEGPPGETLELTRTSFGYEMKRVLSYGLDVKYGRDAGGRRISGYALVPNYSKAETVVAYLTRKNKRLYTSEGLFSSSALSFTGASYTWTISIPSANATITIKGRCIVHP